MIGLIIIALALLFVIFSLLCFAIFGRVKTTSYVVESDKVNKGFRIAFVSDFHNGKNGKKILSLINRQSPDFVILGGDFKDKITGTKRAEEFVKILVQKYKIYFAPGNHEYSSGYDDEFMQFLSDTGVKVLEDDFCQIMVNNNPVQICGIYDGEKLSEKSSEDITQLRRISDITDCGKFRILLAHFPAYAKSYARCGFDLILCGHEHGGIIRIPYYDVAVLGHKGFFPKFAGGLYKFRYSVMIVSKGINYEKYNLIVPRLFNNPELVIIDVKQKQSFDI